LTESSDCQALLLVPEAKLKWTASPTTGVTGQVILRSSAKTGAHSNVGGVTGCTTISSPDTTVTGLGSTFWFKVEAVAG
jgi:hypothetical protein